MGCLDTRPEGVAAPARDRVTGRECRVGGGIQRQPASGDEMERRALLGALLAGVGSAAAIQVRSGESTGAADGGGESIDSHTQATAAEDVGQSASPADPGNVAVRLTRLPGLADNQAGYNGVPFIQDNILTTTGPGGDAIQYAVAWNSSRRPIICRRTLPDGQWTQFDLSTVAGNPLVSPVNVDPHNDICVGIDADGRLHVAGNMHNAPMRYCRSVNPDSITAWTATGRPGGEQPL